LTHHDVVIAGGGFAGIYAAWRLVRSGASVALVEAADQLGGNMRSRPWEGYWLDQGTHVLDLRTALAREFYADVLGDELVSLDGHRWASTVGEGWSMDIEMPDFSVDAPSLAETALIELERLHASGTGLAREPESYERWYRERYGRTLAEAILPMARKLTGGGDPAALSPDAHVALAALSRPKLGTDERMVALKTADPFWDARLGVSLGCADERFGAAGVDGLIGYPAHGGLGGFCGHATRRLAELGVELATGCPIERIENAGRGPVLVSGERRWSGGTLFWTLPDFLLAQLFGVPDRTRELSLPVGTCFVAFEVPEESIAGPNYLNDYAAHRLPTRYNRAGVYGRQTREDGYTVVMAEVPRHPAALRSGFRSEDEAAVWSAMLETGYLRAGTRYRGSTAWGCPVAFSVPRPGWEAVDGELRRGLRSRAGRVVGIPPGRRVRDEFMKCFDTTLQHVLSTDDPHDAELHRRCA